MGDTHVINVEKAKGFLEGLLVHPAFWAVLFLSLGAYDFSKWWNQENVCKQRFEKASIKASKRNAKVNARVVGRSKDRISDDAKRAEVRGAAEHSANTVLDRYEGKTDAVIPADAYGAIQKVR